jgi:serine acetyltransferase
MRAVACVTHVASSRRDSSGERVDPARRCRGPALRRLPAPAATADEFADSSSFEKLTTGKIDYEPQKRHRMSWMHWLHDIPKHAMWARAWQRHVQANLSAMETVRFGEDCFIGEQLHIFAEPGRDVEVGDGTRLGAEVFVHGPVTFGSNVAINVRCHIDVRIGDHAVVGMGAVVTKNVPPWAVVAGNPARVIGDRRTWKKK